MHEDDMPPYSDGTNEIAAIMAQVDAMMAPVLETVVGYRKRIIDAGFSEPTADKMSEDYHNTLMTIIRTKAFGGRG